MTHVHSDSPANWNLAQLRRHFWDEHDQMVPPMFWNLGKLHEMHLNEHHLVTPTSEAEEAPAMPDTDPIEERAEREASADGISWDEVGQETRDDYRERARAFIAEEAPMLGIPHVSHDHGRTVEDWHSNTDRPSVGHHLRDMHGLALGDIDVREVYGQHTALHAAQSTPHVCQVCDSPLEHHEQPCLSTPEPAPELPSAVRAVLSKLVDQVEAAAGPLWALVKDNEALREERAAFQRKTDEWDRRSAEGRAQVDRLVGDNQALRERVASQDRDLSEVRAKWIEAAEERDEAKSALKQAIEERDYIDQLRSALVERRDETLRRLGEVAGERDRALEAGRILEAQRDDARRELALAQAQLHTAGGDVIATAEDLDAVVQERDALATRLAKSEELDQRLQKALADRNRLIREGRAALKQLVARWRDQGEHIEVPVAGVIEAVEQILTEYPAPDEAVSTRVRKAKVFVDGKEVGGFSAAEQPTLDGFTTGQLLREVVHRLNLAAEPGDPV